MTAQQLPGTCSPGPDRAALPRVWVSAGLVLAPTGGKAGPESVTAGRDCRLRPLRVVGSMDRTGSVSLSHHPESVQACAPAASQDLRGDQPCRPVPRSASRDVSHTLRPRRGVVAGSWTCPGEDMVLPVSGPAQEGTQLQLLFLLLVELERKRSLHVFI